MSSVESLSERVRQLEKELDECRRCMAAGYDDTMKSKGARQKVDELSAEVVDSNPYRLLELYFVSHPHI